MGFNDLLAFFYVGMFFWGPTLAIIWFLMRAADRWLHRWIALAVGCASFAYLAYIMVDWMKFCDADPVYFTPTSEEIALGSDGIRFNCDSWMDFIFLDGYMPIMLIAAGILVLCFARRPRSTL